MKGQQGMPQPWPRQQSGCNDMQLWQQQLMCRQLQELQKQQQLQQLDQEAWQQSSSSQFSFLTRQAALDQLPSVINGMPIRDVPNYTWQNENAGCEPRISSSSQMFVAGNMNWTQHGGTTGAHRLPNGLVVSQDQGQVLRSTGLVPQQLDQSLYGIPVSNNRTSLKQYSQYQGVANYFADTMAKSVGNQVEKLSMQSGAFTPFQGDQCLFQEQINVQDGPAANQRLPGKTLFGQHHAHNANSGIMPENFQQLNPLGRSMQVQEFQGGQERADWSGSSQEKTMPQVGPSQGMVKLDPTEEKLLFSTDDGGPWEASFGSGNIDSGASNRNLLEGNNFFNGFPSVQSGSWSALMQSAVAETSSGDTGLHDEWSGVSFQQKELSNGNRPALFVGSGKQQTTWVENLQNASSLTSRPFPLFDDMDVSSNDRTAAVFRQSSFKPSYDHGDEVRAEVSHQPLQQSSKEANGQLDKSQLHNQFLEGSTQTQMHFGITSRDAWAAQFYEQPVSSVPAEAELNQQNVQGSWAHQQNMTSYNVGTRTHGKMNGWSINDAGRDATLKVRDHESTVQQIQVNCPEGIMHVQRDQEGNMWKVDEHQRPVSFPHSTGGFCSVKSGIGSPQVQTVDLHSGSFVGINSNNSRSNQEENQQSLTRHSSDYGKHVSVDSSLKGNEDMGKYRHEVNNGPQAWESSVKTSGKASDEAYERKTENSIQKEVLDEGYISTNRLGLQPIDSQCVGRGKDSSFTGNESRPSASGNQRMSGHTGRKNSGPRKFQFHPMGNLGVNVEAETPADNLYSQMVPRGLKSHESGYIGQSQLAGKAASNSIGDIEKRQLFDSQRIVKGTEEIHPRGTMFSHDSNIPASFDESAAFFVQNRGGQTSQNMLELLHKVDQSRESSSVSSFGFSNHNMISERPDISASDMPSNLQQSSVLQGIGLHLALPSQHQPALTHALSSKTILDHNARHFDTEVEGEKNQTRPTTASSWPPRMHEISGQTSKETSQSNIQTNSKARTASGLPCTRPDFQQQISGTSGRLATDQSVSMPFGNQLDLDTHIKDLSHIRESSDQRSGDMHGEAVADQSGQPLLPGVAGRVAPFSLASSDTHLPVVSHPYSSDMGQPLVVNNPTPHLLSTSQLPGPGARSASQSSVTPCMSQQGAVSAMLHNVWTNISAQQRLPGNLSTRLTPNISPSVSSSALDTSTCVSQRTVDQGNKTGQGTFNSQQFSCGEGQTGKDNSVRQFPPEKVDVAPHMSSALQLPESMSKHAAAGISSAVISSLVRLHQQDVGKSKHEQGLSLDKRAGHASLLNVASSTRDIGSSGYSLKSFDVQQPNYSLLQQVQAMKAIETDQSKRLGKRLKGADPGVGAQQITGKMPQAFIYGYNTVIAAPSDKELSITGNQSSFPSDTKMLCFSSEANVEQNVVKAPQLVGKEVHSQVLAGARHNDAQNHPHSRNISTMSSSIGGHPSSRIDPQMAPSWFGQYENFKSEQSLAMYNGFGGPQKIAKASAQHFPFSKASESTDVPSPAEQRNDSVLVESVWQSSSTTGVAHEHSSLHYAPADAVDHNLIPKPKKRKTATSELLPWHKIITQGSERLQSISKAELNWVHAANRLVEKVADETAMSEGGLSLSRARRRLTLTTQLMQQLLPAVPRKFLSVDVFSQFDCVTYLVAKMALGDACSGVSSSSDSLVPSESRNLVSEKVKTYEMVGDEFFSKVVEGFIGKASKLETDLSRLEKMASISDVKVECQDLERFSIMNRFAKFHGRSQSDGVENSPTSESTPRKLLPQRYVTALSMPGNHPEGAFYLSL
uniref:Putative FAD-linked oxidoreductase ygaK n=1 Tax=Anthurium amnicola TaxID=1678845 RepID=A0A1D1YB14_9ARAE